MPKLTKGLKPGIDERLSRWVLFPNGNEHLLPVVARHQRLVPIFNEDGTAEITVEHPDEKLKPLVDRFFELVASVEDRAVTISAPQVYADFLALIRRLLLTNYEMENSELVSLLTLSNQQVSYLFGVILTHLLAE